MDEAIKEQNLTNTEFGIDHYVDRTRRGDNDFDNVDFSNRNFR